MSPAPHRIDRALNVTTEHRKRCVAGAKIAKFFKDSKRLTRHSVRSDRLRSDPNLVSVKPPDLPVVKSPSKDSCSKIMPTINGLIDEGIFTPITVELGFGEQPARLLYGTKSFLTWLEERMNANELSPLAADTTPAEQIDDLFYRFISGRPLVYSRQFRFIRAEADAVWELKTPDIRIFGWFVKRDCFVAVFGAWADRVKDHDLYRGYRLEIRRLRRELGIDSTLCVQGVEPSEVISL